MLASRIALFTFLASSAFTSGLTSATFSVSGFAFAVSLSTFSAGAVAATEASAACTSVADTAPLPRNIKPAAIATEAAPKLYLRIP